MPRLVPLTALLTALLSLAACSEPVPDVAPPLDRFYYPSGMALAPSAGGTPSLLVASSNFDLQFGPELGGSLIAVDPVASLGAADGALTLRGTEIIGSYSGQVAVAHPASCPGLVAPMALVSSRYTRQLHVVPLAADGALAACPAGGCSRALDADLIDPFAITLACRADGARRTALVAYLTTPAVGPVSPGTAWISELDLDDPARGLRTYALGVGPVVDMAYDAGTDRLYAVGRFTGPTAPIFVVGLDTCRPGDSCGAHSVSTIDLFGSYRGADLQGIALSNPVAGQKRRAYVSARVYDADLAAALGGRPGFDLDGVLLVLDLDDDAAGEPRARIVRAVDLEPGPGQVRVLPARAGLRDLVVVSNQTTGMLTVYDDETGAVVRQVALEPATGIPQVGRQPYAMAVRDLGAVAEVYVASFLQSTVSVLQVPLGSPSLADLKRGPPPASQPLRIGKERK